MAKNRLTIKADFPIREVKKAVSFSKESNGEVTAGSPVLRVKLEFSTNNIDTKTCRDYFAFLQHRNLRPIIS
jgi:hypothetical protein